MFVQGSKDPFGSLEGMGNALKAIAGETRFVAIEGAGHDLKKGSFDLAALVVGPFLKWRE